MTIKKTMLNAGLISDKVLISILPTGVYARDLKKKLKITTEGVARVLKRFLDHDLVFFEIEKRGKSSHKYFLTERGTLLKKELLEISNIFSNYWVVIRDYINYIKNDAFKKERYGV